MNTDLIPWIVSVTGFAFAMSGSPGPNNTMVSASGANFGLKATTPHMAGIIIGFFVMLVSVALGLGDVIMRFPVLQEILKWVGGGYLLWLAYRMSKARPVVIRNRDGDRTEARAERSEGSRVKPLSFMQAALFQWVNPKAWIVAVSAVATFADNGAAMGIKTALMPVIFAVVTVPLLILWTLIGVGAARLLSTPRSMQIFNYTMAALLIASVVPQFL